MDLEVGTARHLRVTVLTLGGNGTARLEGLPRSSIWNLWPPYPISVEILPDGATQRITLFNMSFLIRISAAIASNGRKSRFPMLITMREAYPRAVSPSFPMAMSVERPLTPWALTENRGLSWLDAETGLRPWPPFNANAAGRLSTLHHTGDILTTVYVDKTHCRHPLNARYTGGKTKRPIHKVLGPHRDDRLDASGSAGLISPPQPSPFGPLPRGPR
jgi:hypothetical protein